KPAGVLNAGFQWNGAARASRRRDDAERAAVSAAVLHLEVGPRLVGIGGKGQGGKLGVGESLVHINRNATAGERRSRKNIRNRGRVAKRDNCFGGQPFMAV